MANRAIHDPARVPTQDAARHRIDRTALEFARAKRAKRVSWYAIAGMLGVSEPDIRAAADPDYAKRTVPAADEAEQTLGEGLTQRLRAVFRLTVEEARALALLLTPAGREYAPDHEDAGHWRSLMRGVTVALGVAGLGGALQDIGGNGTAGERRWLISRDSARRIRAHLSTHHA